MPWTVARRRVPLTLLVLAALGCDSIAPTEPIGAGDCFGDVPYAFRGWTTMGEAGVGGGGDAQIYMLITRDEVQLTHSPIVAPGERGFSVMGRGRCWTADGSTIVQEAFGPTRTVPDP